MKFIVLPLTEPTKERKQQLVEKTVSLAKNVEDEMQQLFIIAGILVATDKFIDRDYSNSIKEWISMTKVARLFEEEKIEAVNNAVNQTILLRNRLIATEMLRDGEDILKIMKYSSLTKEEILHLQEEVY